MAYRLRRERDGAGDSGPILTLIKVRKNEKGFWEPDLDENGKMIYEHGEKPKVGYCVRVGSLIARTYQMYDYWTTTPVEEILETTEDSVKFRTTNSIYTLSW